MAVHTASMTLVQDAKQGDQVAFMSLLEPLLEPGYRLACGMLHDHQAAEDAVQEAAFKAWRKLGQLREGHEPRPWFLGIVANECRTVRDPQHGLIIAWASAASPVVLLVTSDGGSTWSARSVPGEFQLADDFVDADHGWLIAGSASDFDPPGAAVALPLYKTDDGGLTWVPVPTNILLRSPESVIGHFHFVDRNNGFMVRWANQSNDFSQLLKTTDGGRTWTVVAETLRKP